MNIHQALSLGPSTPRTAIIKAKKLSNFAIKHIPSIISQKQDGTYLDVGCGNGFITSFISSKFKKTIGIDLRPDHVKAFKETVKGNSQYEIYEMSADNIEFPDNRFSFITCFEVLEHVANLHKVCDEIVRVLAPGGIFILSVPQIFFPFEGHGVTIGNRSFNKIPFLPWIPPIHRRYSPARVFSSLELDNLFKTRGIEVLDKAYVAPQFEGRGQVKGTWENKLVAFKRVFTLMEKIPLLRIFIGVSLLKAYRKPL